MMDKADAILNERNQMHGDYKDNFRAIATMWNAWLSLRGNKLNEADVPIMMILFKFGRMVSRMDDPATIHHDSPEDVVGYAKLLNEFLRFLRDLE